MQDGDFWETSWKRQNLEIWWSDGVLALQGCRRHGDGYLHFFKTKKGGACFWEMTVACEIMKIDEDWQYIPLYMYILYMHTHQVKPCLKRAAISINRAPFATSKIITRSRSIDSTKLDQARWKSNRQHIWSQQKRPWLAIHYMRGMILIIIFYLFLDVVMIFEPFCWRIPENFSSTRFAAENRLIWWTSFISY